MKLYVHKKDCLLFCLFIAFIGSAFFYLLFKQNAFFLILLFFLLCFCVLAPHMLSCSFSLQERQVILQKGLIIRIMQRIPISYLSGYRIIRTPIDFISNTCILWLSFSGGMCLIVGLNYREVSQMMSEIFSKGENHVI